MFLKLERQIVQCVHGKRILNLSTENIVICCLVGNTEELTFATGGKSTEYF